MHRLIGLGCAALLIGCTPAQAPQQGYRRDAAITSIVFFDPARLAGDWFEVAAFRPPAAAPCQQGYARFTPRPAGELAVVQASCAGPDPAPRSGVATLTGPGRLTVTAGAQTEVWWILWADEAYRTVVIGMPSGKIGLILNRDRQIPPDRMQAARDILAWNGYDLARLVPAMRP